MVKVLGVNGNGYKDEIIRQIISEFSIKYPTVEVEAYLGYPIYIEEYSNRRISVDLALLTKIGIFIFNILETPVTDYEQIQDEIYLKVENKFKKQPNLVKHRKLCFDYHTITFSKEPIPMNEQNPLAYTIDDVFLYINKMKQDHEFDNDLFKLIISGIQEAYGINLHLEREGLTEGTKAYTISQTKHLIEKYDETQMEAILSDTTGIQRIRGMAGSGKTIILARKAVELHTAHPDWNIAVTYSTRSIRDQLVKLINRFYSAKNDGAKYDDTKLKVMQAWGSANSKGLYYEICLRHGLSPLNFTEARSIYGKTADHFSKICGAVLKDVKQFNKLYDCILIDEAQDFDKNFLKLCLNVVGSEERLVYAYDELQKLNEESMSSPNDLFGKAIKNDTPLTVCYRNQSKAIVTAHAIGMGLYRNDGLIQIPDINVWKAIGYFHDEDLEEGKRAVLYRTEKTSPDLLNVDPDEVIEFICYQDRREMNVSLLEMIHRDLSDEQLLPRDIMIIDMDTFKYNENKLSLSMLLNSDDKYEDINIHVAGAANPEDFFRDNSVVYSSVRRAKGNETFVVYIVNAQKCMTALTRRSDRNALFTAITRSKGWVRVLGFGDDMDELCEEFDRIKENDFKLVFEKYPTKEEQKQLIMYNQDLEGKDVYTLDSARNLIEKLRKSKSVSDIQLMKEFFGYSDSELISLLKKLKEDE